MITVHVGWETLVQTYENVISTDWKAAGPHMIMILRLEDSVVFLRDWQWLEVIGTTEVEMR